MTGFYDEASLPLWSDNPAKADLLGFTDVSEPIAQAICRERLNPIAVGVAGPWGSGKITVLNLLAAELAGDPRVLVVETSPWAYDPKLDVKVTLIGEVLARLYAHADTALGPTDEVTKGVKKLVEKVRWSKAFALAAKTAKP
jgi:predicted KAP-like P-loop ATPase